MKTLFAALSVAMTLGAGHASADGWRPPPGLAQVPIWPREAPDARTAAGPESSSVSRDLVAGKPVVWVENVARPTMTLYSPKARSTGAAVIVFPGGGYMGLAMDLEGTEVCDSLASKGISCILLKYRVPRSGQYYDQKLHRHVEPEAPAALQDAQRTVSLVRARAARWGIDPRKIGVLGFSAGGHLAAQASTAFKRRAYRPVDGADKESCRPDFAVPIYPGHLRASDESAELKLNPKMRVPPDAPPTFLLQAEDDHVDGVEQSLVYYRALQKAGVPVEMHLYAQGGHAFGLRPGKFPITRWPGLVEAWLGTIGMIPE
jgi:acetyl esterase/lipase